MERKKEGMWFQTWSRYWDPSSDGQTQELCRPEGCPGESNDCSSTLWLKEQSGKLKLLARVCDIRSKPRAGLSYKK